MVEAKGYRPSFPFGYGLGYVKLQLGPPKLVELTAEDGVPTATVEVDVTNPGTRKSGTVVQVYVAESLGSEPRPLRTLRGFARCQVEPGDNKCVTIKVPVDRRVGPLYVGTSSALEDLVQLDIPD